MHIDKAYQIASKSVMGWFDGEENFKTMHKDKLDIDRIEEWLWM